MEVCLITDLATLELIIKDPWEFAKHCCFTYDPQDTRNPIKPFPVRYNYLKAYFRTWQQKRLMAVPKSRRMFLSWATLILYTWDTMFHAGRRTAFVSKKEEDADELLERVKFMIDQIKERGILPPDIVPRSVKTYCELDFPDIGSKIQAFSSGSDALRMHGFSGIMGDEMAFWPFAELMYASAMPTIEGGGRFTAISSPAPGLFKDIVFDALKGNEGPGGAKKITDVMQGVKVWQNPKNKFWVFELHYTANPEKRDPAYIENMRRSMPRSQFRQEFELEWESYIGSPVYPDFDSKKHVVRNLKPELGLPLLIGFDFGLNASAVIAQLQMDTLVILKEYTSSNMGIDRFLAQVLLPALKLDFPKWNNHDKDFLCFIDPSGNFRKDTDESTCAMSLIKAGFKPMPGDVVWEKRRSSVEHFLLKYDKNGACFQIDEEKCPTLVKGFTGEYRYPDNAMEIEPAKLRPIKNESSHPQDALQYIAGSMLRIQKPRAHKVPNLQYGFGRQRM